MRTKTADTTSFGHVHSLWLLLDVGSDTGAVSLLPPPDGPPPGMAEAGDALLLLLLLLFAL